MARLKACPDALPHPTHPTHPTHLTYLTHPTHLTHLTYLPAHLPSTCGTSD
jgi:hypothetical protein